MVMLLSLSLDAEPSITLSKTVGTLFDDRDNGSRPSACLISKLLAFIDRRDA